MREGLLTSVSGSKAYRVARAGLAACGARVGWGLLVPDGAFAFSCDLSEAIASGRATSPRALQPQLRTRILPWGRPSALSLNICRPQRRGCGLNAKEHVVFPELVLGSGS
jgi:hypothetical protein